MDKSIYRMSEAGGCPKALSAMKLGYEPIPRTKTDEDRLNYYTRCEELAAEQILNLGYRIQPSVKCHDCWIKYRNERYGIHVELDNILFKLIGHLDRRLITEDGKRLPVEIKSLGRFSWQNFKRYQFEKFSGYACQEACYLEAENSPGIYWVMNRDTGENLRYIINDYKGIISLDGFEKLELPVKYQDIIDKLNNVELCVQDGQLAEGEVSDSCRWCRFRFLCGVEKEEKVKEENLPSLVEAAQLYKTGHELERQGKDQKEQAKMSFIFHARDNKVDKFRVERVSVSYRGQKTKKWLDEKILKESVSEDIIRLATKESSPYDDISIRILKEEK